MIAIYQARSYTKNLLGGMMRHSKHVWGSSKTFSICVVLPKEIDNPKEFQCTYSQ